MNSYSSSAVSNFIIPQAEALPLPKNFLLGDTPKLVKKTETVKQLAPPEAPLLEKRYNIFDENGNKVYQSKSIDDAQQKALKLGDLEGKEFTVKEIKTDIKELQNIISDAISNYHDGCVSITCIEEHNTAQFHENPVYNKLTTKQIRKFNQNPHG